MIKTTIIRSLDYEFSFFDWLTLSAEGVILAQGQNSNWTEFPSIAEEDAIILLSPAQETLILAAKLPPMPWSKLIQAIPYALEEQLTTEIEELHFATGTLQTDGYLPIAVTSQSRMESWFAKFFDLLTHPIILTPDLLALPDQKEQWYCSIEDHQALIKTGEQSGYVCEPENFAIQLKILLEEKPETKPRKIIIDLFTESFAHEEQLISLNSEIEIRRPQKSWLEFVAPFVVQNKVINLLQGEFQAASKFSQLRKQWRWPLRLAGVLVLSFFLYQLIDFIMLKHAVHTSQAQINQLYQQLYPNITDPDIAQNRFEHDYEKLKKNLSGGRFLKIISQLADIWQAYKMIHITQLSYSNQIMTVSIETHDLNKLEELAKKVSRSGLSLSQSNVSTFGKLTKAQWTIK
jgi:general secretion pathway protein L